MLVIRKKLTGREELKEEKFNCGTGGLSLPGGLPPMTSYGILVEDTLEKRGLD